MRKLEIDDTTRFLLREAFKRDVPYEPEPTLFYLDLSTGHVTWVYERDEDADHVTGNSAEKNREARLLLQSQPDRFVLIPGLSHADHHAILLDFLSSDWTDDEESRTAVRDAYSGSIGRWKGPVALGVVDAGEVKQAIDQRYRRASASSTALLGVPDCDSMVAGEDSLSPVKFPRIASR